LLLLGAAGTPHLRAAGAIGDKAGAVDVSDWVKGAPVDLSRGRGSNVFVVEFWATWCPPCRISIPLLTDLQRQYRDKGLVVVGISNEEPELVKPFVAQMGDQMNYSVAVDREGVTHARYMDQYELQGIPTAFVVNQEGRVVWVGSPLTGLSNAVAQVLAGKLDLAESTREFARKKKQYAYQAVFQKYAMLCMYGARDQATTAGQALFDIVKGEAALSKTLALDILQDGRFRFRDLNLARKAASEAVSLTGRNDNVSLAALAISQYYLGEMDTAVGTLKEAIAKTTDPNQRQMLERDLATFQQRAAAAAK
jgi:thiol-disulfide isomerase/thioredoxin